MRFLVTWRYTSEAHANFGRRPMDRRTASSAIAQSFGGRLIEFHFTFGSWDGAAMYEFPSPTHAAAFAIYTKGTGGFDALETIVLLAPEETDQAMQMVSETKMIVKPPQVP